MISSLSVESVGQNYDNFMKNQSGKLVFLSKKFQIQQINIFKPVKIDV
jgi:hypothetical protein